MQGPIHAWDCACGTRNAPQFSNCRRCARPVSQGRAVYPHAAAPQVRPPAPPAPQPAPGYPPAPGYQPFRSPAPVVPTTGAPPQFYPRPEAVGRRTVAWTIDYGLTLVILMALFWLIDAGAPNADARAALRALILLPMFGITFAFITLWAYGQTPGMKVMRLRMIGPDGRRPGLLRAFGRWVGQHPSMNCLGLGYLWMLWDPEQQTWHDKWVGIRVVKA